MSCERLRRVANARVPVCCVDGVDTSAADNDTVLCDIIVDGRGCVEAIVLKKEGKAVLGNGMVEEDVGDWETLDARGGIVFPAFADLHTHIDKGHTCERSKNPIGSLSGADASTAKDSTFWSVEDVYRRMDFSLRCAYAHGTSALRTHLINISEKQVALTWPVFAALRERWRGRVELQGVSLQVLSFYRDRETAARHADIVARHGGILGAAVCCGDTGGLPEDDWTTCEGERDALLDVIFQLAGERGLDLDFHVDENGNEEARGLRDVARAVLRHRFKGSVVCGHCCSLMSQSPADLDKTLALCKQAGVTVVSLPLVNEWTQDRHPGRTPRWRGVTALHEVRAAGVDVALASDNTRDQFYEYGDLDMLEVLTESVRIAQLDRPGSVGAWPDSITRVPHGVMGTGGGVIRVGAQADLVLFPGRKFNELMSRRMVRRLVVRSGTVVRPRLPDYSELDYDPAKYSYRLPPRPEQLEGILEVAEAVGVRPWDVTLGGRFREGVPELSSHCSRCLMEECACHSCYLVRRRSSFLSPRDALDAPWSEEPPAECQCPDCGATLPVRAGVRFADGRGARQKDECEERASVGAQGEEAGSLHGWVTWEPTEKYSASEDRAGRSRRSSLTRGSDMEEGARRLAQSPPLFVSSKRARDWGGVLGSVLTGCAVGALMGAAVTHVWHRASR